MSKTYYIYSTLTSAQIYTATEQGGGDLPEETGRVYIAGGANVPDKYLRTPRGVVTPVSEEELSILEANPVFVMHKQNGFITISEKNADPEKVAADMETRDESAPLVDGDFEDENKPKTNAPKASSRKA